MSWCRTCKSMCSAIFELVSNNLINSTNADELNPDFTIENRKVDQVYVYLTSDLQMMIDLYLPLLLQTSSQYEELTSKIS